MESALILRMLTVLLAIATGGRLVMAGIRFVTDRQPPAALAMLLFGQRGSHFVVVCSCDGWVARNK